MKLTSKAKNNFKKNLKKILSITKSRRKKLLIKTVSRVISQNQMTLIVSFYFKYWFISSL